MRNGTRLRLTCGRCGQPRELIGHVCVVRSGRAARRRATPKPKLDFGKCAGCGRPLGNPLTHVCKPRSDFKKRKRQAAAPKKKPREQHDYQLCKENDCHRPLCVAFKVGYRGGYQNGWTDCYDLAYKQGHEDGIADCPRPHGG
jgi:hypothetical protein